MSTKDFRGLLKIFDSKRLWLKAGNFDVVVERTLNKPLSITWGRLEENECICRAIDYILCQNFEIQHEEKHRAYLRMRSQGQQGCFTKLSTAKEGHVTTSYVLAHKTARRKKPFSWGEFISAAIHHFFLALDDRNALTKYFEIMGKLVMCSQ